MARPRIDFDNRMRRSGGHMVAMRFADHTPTASARGGAMKAMNAPRVGMLIRDWRTRRRLSQMELALEAGISPRHLSFVETGRSQPGRSALMSLAEVLDVPLRDRNMLLLAAGLAPAYAERSLDDSALEPAREAVARILRAHEPFPAVAVDRCWNLVLANQAVTPLLAGVAAHLLQPPVNVLRLTLHPEGMAPRIENLPEWRTHLLSRLRRQSAMSPSAELDALLEELSGYPGDELRIESHALAIVVPLQLRTPAGVLSLISTTTVFGTPLEITLAELALESFFPADAATAAALRRAEFNPYAPGSH
jgi:transcriptional regulator with XRE-family HTH domain